MTDTFASTDDRRVQNGPDVMRHQYRVLTEPEKAQMLVIKDHGAAFLDLVSRIGESRELSLAKTKIEEAVMWAVKHVTR